MAKPYQFSYFIEHYHYGMSQNNWRKLLNQPYPYVDLNKVSNLDKHLPVFSTPQPKKTRISRCRRPLPKEIQDNSDDKLPAFLSKLNPFKKKPFRKN